MGPLNLALVLYATGDIDGTATHNEMAIRHFLADRYQEGIASGAELVAIVELERGRTDRALVLLGATETIWDTLGIVPWPELWYHLGPLREQARDVLGDAEYERQLDRGRGMSLDSLIDELARLLDDELL